ncbi:ABC transporter ATP-binding protein [Alcaligenaceae bacterium SJ-26]|nr:ABC transporter ATP-binding protein [Alcaligenaceae bacterium SJ-26]
MLIEFEQAGVEAAGRPILQQISLRLVESRVGVVGLNGAGKSTLARLVNGLVLPTTGSVRVDGLDTRSQAGTVRRRVGFMFQNPADQIVFPIVREDMAFGLQRLGLTRAEQAQRIDAQLAALGLSALAERPAHALSGGEQQMAALAAVLVCAPEAIVFDEPTNQLDLLNRERLRAVLKTLPQQLLVLTHDLPLLDDFDRVLVMEQGKLVADDAPAAALDWYRRRCATLGGAPC